MADVSFLDNENQMVIDAEMSAIADQLLDDWIQSNLDESVFYSDYQIAMMCDSNYLKGRFNQYYDLKPEDEHYIEWDEEA
jgi:hypothetical protein